MTVHGPFKAEHFGLFTSAHFTIGTGTVFKLQCLKQTWGHILFGKHANFIMNVPPIKWGKRSLKELHWNIKDYFFPKRYLKKQQQIKKRQQKQNKKFFFS